MQIIIVSQLNVALREAERKNAVLQEEHQKLQELFARQTKELFDTANNLELSPRTALNRIRKILPGERVHAVAMPAFEQMAGTSSGNSEKTL